MTSITNKTEWILTEDNLYDHKDIDRLISISLQQGIGGVNVPYILLEQYPELDKFRLGLNLDLLVTSMGYEGTKLWSGFTSFNYINISPNIYDVEYENFSKIEDETIEILQVMPNARIFIDWFLLEDNPNKLIQLAQIYESVGFDHIMIGTFAFAEQCDHVTNIGNVARIKKNLSIPVGIFGDFSELDLLPVEKRYNFHTYGQIYYPES